MTSPTPNSASIDVAACVYHILTSPSSVTSALSAGCATCSAVPPELSQFALQPTMLTLLPSGRGSCAKCQTPVRLTLRVPCLELVLRPMLNLQPATRISVPPCTMCELPCEQPKPEMYVSTFRIGNADVI